MKTNLKMIRESRTNYTQRDMANLLGVEVSTYSKWEQGQRDISAPNLIKLVRILKTTADNIIGTDYSLIDDDKSALEQSPSTDEQRLLDAYRQLDETDKTIIMRVVNALLGTTEHGEM